VDWGHCVSDNGSGMGNYGMGDYRMCDHRVNWGMVSWSGVRDWLGLGEVGDTFILDIGDVAASAVRVGCVGDNLGASVGKGDPVVASDSLGV